MDSIFSDMKDKVEKLQPICTATGYCVNKNKVLNIINQSEEKIINQIEDAYASIIKKEMLLANNMEELQAVRKKYENKLYDIFVPIFDGMIDKIEKKDTLDYYFKGKKL